MKKSNNMYLVTKLTGFSEENLTTLTLDWLSFIRILTKPLSYQTTKGTLQDFDLAAVKALLTSLTATDKLWLKIISEGGEFQLRLVEGSLFEQSILAEKNYFSAGEIIEDYVDQRMKKFGVYGYIRSFDEYLMNNIEALEKRLFNTSEEVRALPKRYNKNQRVIIDCNQLAGYDLFYKELCFTACWKMYITPYYYQIIPRPIFEEVQHVQAIESLDEKTLKITLHQDPMKWDQEINLKDQRLLRNQLGFDQLAWSNGVGVLREPSIEFAYVGDTIQTVQYQNNFFQPVTKKKATYFVTRNYDIKRETGTVKRTKGRLNAQAYFPWIDQENKRMMNYRVLDPKLTLDNGLSAYEFYIRQFLEIDVVDEQYPSFLSVLRFYLPKEAMEHLPLEALHDKLDDMNILNFKEEDEYLYFDVKKAKNHLRVMFLDYDQLGDLSGLLNTAK
jgi:hypothetical protein